MTNVDHPAPQLPFWEPFTLNITDVDTCIL